MSERYLGQLALVAGGTGGLGRAVSVAFLEEGATVAASCGQRAML
jgi:NAD(P)-dependent dehydrogenase (short-subunit alcohol dehydrogenase family)